MDQKALKKRTSQKEAIFTYLSRKFKKYILGGYFPPFR